MINIELIKTKSEESWLEQADVYNIRLIGKRYIIRYLKQSENHPHESVNLCKYLEIRNKKTKRDVFVSKYMSKYGIHKASP